MKKIFHNSRWMIGGLALSMIAFTMLTACGTDVKPALQGQSATPAVTLAPPTELPKPTAPPAATATAVPLKALKVTPEQGQVGTEITLAAEGLPPGKTVEFVWATMDGSYNMKATTETIEYYDRKFAPSQTTLGRATSDSSGRVSSSFKVPDDYGENHDIVAMVDGQKVAQGTVAVVRNVIVSPLKGPVGTPITIEVKGLGTTPFANTMGVLYDNKYTGFLSAVTTRGTGRAIIRAAGTLGQHEIRVTDASAATPYLNTEQSPRKLPQFKFVFTVTEDNGAPSSTLEWPEASRSTPGDSLVKTASTGVLPPTGVKINSTSRSGPIFSKTTVQATGLPADSAVDTYWVTVKGNRVSASGWNLVQNVATKATVGKDGVLNANVDIPDDLGGWHTLKVAQGEKVLGEVPYFIERSLVGITPTKVKAGETFKLQAKGIGWTELDNGFAVTYDNAYIGYACGFNSQGDVTIFMQATGGRGTHLIDLYPMIFKGHGEGIWNYNIPMLTALQDHPGLSLGYKLPIFRLAIEVTD